MDCLEPCSPDHANTNRNPNSGTQARNTDIGDSYADREHLNTYHRDGKSQPWDMGLIAILLPAHIWTNLEPNSVL